MSSYLATTILATHTDFWDDPEGMFGAFVIVVMCYKFVSFFK